MPKPINVITVVGAHAELAPPAGETYSTHAIVDLVTEEGQLDLRISRSDATDLVKELAQVWPDEISGKPPN